MKKVILLMAMLISGLQFNYGQAGQLDSSFGHDGIVTTDFGFLLDITYPSNCKQVLPNPDGSLYAIIRGEFSYISKRLPNGSPDLSYGNNSFSVPADIDARKAAQQADGKIVMVGGRLTVEGNYVVALVRYDIDGTLDNSFFDHVKEINNLGMADAVALQSDGKIVLAGVVGYQSVVFRYNSDGSPDSSFGTGGMQRVFGFNSNALAVAIQKDGKIVVAGRGEFVIARFNTDGSFDSSFSGDGKANTNSGSSIQANAVAIQPDGKIVVAGIGDNMVAVARYNIDGSLDMQQQTSYNPSGEVQHVDYADAVAIQTDGKIVVGGSVLIRYNANGNLDSTFGAGGIQPSLRQIVSAVIQNGQKIVVGGADFDFARHNTDGSLDKTFGVNGVEVGKLQFKQGSTFYTATAVQKDGKVVAVGKTWTGKYYSFAIARYSTDGSLDTTFDNDGRQTTDFGSDFSANAINIQTDGKIVAAGNSLTSLGLVRYNTNGSLDLTFSKDGKQTKDFNSYFLAGSVVTQSDGKIIVAGTNNNFLLLRFDAQGNLDSTFSGDGIEITSFYTYGEGAKSVSIQNDGKIVAAGYAYPGNYFSFAVARYNPDGVLDNTFGDGGRITTIVGHESFATSSTIQKDGKIIVGGWGDNYGVPLATGRDFAVVRYNADGSLDSAFNKSGKQITDFHLFEDYVNAIAIQKDGKIVLGGAAGLSNFANADFGLVRYNSDGSLDSSFNKTGKQTTEVYRKEYSRGITGIAIGDNKLYAVGSGRFPNDLGVVAKYLLDDKINRSPIVTLTTPANNTTRLAPASIKLTAAASDTDGTISKIEFYNGTHLLHTEYKTPYGFQWKDVPVGIYTLTAKAYDNSGLVTSSTPVHISVVPNKHPTISIIKPKNNQPFAAPGYIHLQADAKDVDGRITRVEFYNGSTLLRTEYKYPYTYVWKNLPVGSYNITAVATDNWGAHTTSYPVTFRIIPPTTIVSNKPTSEVNKPGITDAVSLILAPNPTTNILNIYTTELQQNKPVTISVLSASGVVVKTMQTNSLTKTVQLDVSSLVSGVYTIKLISGNKVLYKEFVKM